ncbi:hypothetical protein HDV04_005854 [Boothiomyces sp. JEL0838]|nr:hypothetical protein HDV04_005854 [Boothiomyces sp. JEL0838]
MILYVLLCSKYLLARPGILGELNCQAFKDAQVPLALLPCPGVDFTTTVPQDALLVCSATCQGFMKLYKFNGNIACAGDIDRFNSLGAMTTFRASCLTDTKSTENSVNIPPISSETNPGDTRIPNEDGSQIAETNSPNIQNGISIVSSDPGCRLFMKTQAQLAVLPCSGVDFQTTLPQPKSAVCSPTCKIFMNLYVFNSKVACFLDQDSIQKSGAVQVFNSNCNLQADISKLPNILGLPSLNTTGNPICTLFKSTQTPIGELACPNVDLTGGSPIDPVAACALSCKPFLAVFTRTGTLACRNEPLSLTVFQQLSLVVSSCPTNKSQTPTTTDKKSGARKMSFEAILYVILLNNIF